MYLSETFLKKTYSNVHQPNERLFQMSDRNGAFFDDQNASGVHNQLSDVFGKVMAKVVPGSPLTFSVPPNW
jgi:hypothetical protein